MNAAVFAWLALADGLAALFLAALVYVISRRSRHPISARAAMTLGLVVAIPVLLLYGIVLMFVQLVEE